jgi:hypothetical protein
MIYSYLSLIILSLESLKIPEDSPRLQVHLMEKTKIVSCEHQ